MKFEWLDLSYDEVAEGEKPARFGFECPRHTNGRMCSGLMLRESEHTASNLPRPERRTWEWDGNREKPTFSPSIDCGGCGWHGYIREGKAT